MNPEDLPIQSEQLVTVKALVNQRTRCGVVEYQVIDWLTESHWHPAKKWQGEGGPRSQAVHQHIAQHPVPMLAPEEGLATARRRDGEIIGMLVRLVDGNWRGVWNDGVIGQASSWPVLLQSLDGNYAITPGWTGWDQ